MRKSLAIAVSLPALLLNVYAQEFLPPEPPPLFWDLQRNIEYASLVSAVSLSGEQLTLLSRLQEEYLAVGEVTPEVEDALREVAMKVAKGTPQDEAFEQLGELRADVNEARERTHRARLSLAAELQASLTPEQSKAMVLFNSPVRGIRHMATTIKRIRKAPRAGWERFRTDVAHAISRMAARGGKTVTVEEAAKRLDELRALPDAEFDKKADTLGDELAAEFMPGLVERLTTGPEKDERLRDICTHLISHPGGSEVIQSLTAKE